MGNNFSQGFGSAIKDYEMGDNDSAYGDESLASEDDEQMPAKNQRDPKNIIMRDHSSSDEFKSDEGDPLYDSQDDENLSR